MADRVGQLLSQKPHSMQASMIGFTWNANIRRFDIRALLKQTNSTNRCDVLEIGDVNPRIVIEDDSGIQDVRRVKNVFDFSHEFHALSAPLQ